MLERPRPFPFPHSLETSLTHPDNEPPQGLMEMIGLTAEMRLRGETVTSLAGGIPPEIFLKEIWEDIPDVSKDLQKKVSAVEALQYGDASGNRHFRGWAAENVGRLTGKEISPKNIITVPGLQFGIAASLLTLCAREKKMALAQIPTYAGFLEAAGDPSIDVPVVSIKSDREGIIPSSLEETVNLLIQKGIEPGLVYTMVVGNPSGGIMSDERGEELNEICRHYGMPLFVDHAYHGLTFSNLEESQIPKVPYLDDNVMLGFSTSKLGFPGARVGYMAIQKEELYMKIKGLKQNMMIMSPPQNELQIWQLFEREDFSNRVERAAKVYEEGASRGMHAVKRNSDVFSAENPKGGMFLWVKVNNGISTWKECGRILNEQHIAYAPGRWSQPRRLELSDGTVIGEPVVDNYMRLCVTTEKPEVVEGAIDGLANTFRKGVKSYSPYSQRGALPMRLR